MTQPTLSQDEQKRIKEVLVKLKVLDTTDIDGYFETVILNVFAREKKKSRQEGAEAPRWIGIYDRKGNKVYENDLVGLPYVPPFGGVGMDDELVYKAKIVFKNASYMLEMIDYPGYTENVQVLDWLVKEKGEYISNYGERTIITDKAKFEVLTPPEATSKESHEI